MHEVPTARGFDLRWQVQIRAHCRVAADQSPLHDLLTGSVANLIDVTLRCWLQWKPVNDSIQIASSGSLG